MTVTETAATATTTSEVVDTARTAAGGTRAAAKWMASALGAVPSLAVIGAIVRDPGEGGFDPTELAIGVALAGLGALIGVLGFARVIAPVRLEDKDLERLDLKRIPGQPYTSFVDLAAHVDTVRAAAVSDEFAANRMLQRSKKAEATAVAVEQAAAEAQAAAKAQPADSELEAAAAQAKRQADAARAAADAASAEAAASAAGQSFWAEQLTRYDQIREDAYGLKAADEVAQRFNLAQVLSFLAVALIAAGVVLIGLAPEPKPKDPPAASTTLVTLTPNKDGKRVLGCDAAALQALRTGGTDTAPVVVTLPTATCPAKTLTFQAADPRPLGSVTAVKPVKVDG